VLAEGWHNWQKPEAEQTAFCAGYKSRGPGAATTKQVAWSWQLTRKEARVYTWENILAGKDGWDPLKVYPVTKKKCVYF
jgi:pectinesterase